MSNEVNVKAYKPFVAEFLGTLILVAVVVGSGIMGTNMSSDNGVALLINTISTIFALGILIYLLSPLSGAHFNPAVTLSEFLQKRLSLAKLVGYVAAQCVGGVMGTILANLMFKLPAINRSHHLRSGSNLFLGEVVATAGLLFFIQLLGNQSKSKLAPIVVPAWIGSAYFFTSSTSFANPAVTISRAFSDTFAGIDLKSVPMFIVAQLIGAALGVLLGRSLS
jgi:glycerol uptake facilitator-like aquaporin